MLICLINLDRSRDRLDWMTTQLDAKKLAFERQTAFTPEAIPERLARRFHENACEILMPQEIACFASHLAVAERLLASAAPYCLALEDDVELLCDADTLRALGEKSRAFDLLRLNSSSKRPAVELDQVGAFRIVTYLQQPYGAGSYFLTRSGARKILSRAVGLAIPVDNFFCAEAFLNLDVANVQPPPAPQDRFTGSSIDPDGKRKALNPKRRKRGFFYRATERTPAIAVAMARAARTARQIGVRNVAQLNLARLAMELRRGAGAPIKPFVLPKRR